MWFKKKKEKEDISLLLDEKFKSLQEKVFLELASLKVENQSLKNEIATKQRVIDEQREKLRQQNEADIFLMVKKIEKEILEGKKKEELTSELRDLANLQQQSSQFSQYGIGFIGGLGGGIFR